MDTTFRRATPADADAILPLMRAYYAEDGYPFHEAEARAALAALLGEESLGAVWVACEGEAIVGYAALTLGYSLEYLGRDAFVDELFVLESHRGRGLGAQALATMEDECRRRGVRALHLEVERGKAGALASIAAPASRTTSAT